MLHYVYIRSESKGIAGGSDSQGLQCGSSGELCCRGTSSHHTLVRQGQPAHQFQTNPAEVTVGPTNSPCPCPAQPALTVHHCLTGIKPSSYSTAWANQTKPGFGCRLPSWREQIAAGDLGCGLVVTLFPSVYNILVLKSVMRVWMCFLPVIAQRKITRHASLSGSFIFPDLSPSSSLCQIHA